LKYFFRLAGCSRVEGYQMTDKKIIEEKRKYRVFISYSHENLAIVKDIVKILSNAEIEVMWDRKFNFGHGFHDQIKTFIAHSHVFIPIITKESSHRGWVHQEIGYAMALNIPVLPIAIDKLTGEMIREIHAISTDIKLKDLKRVLTKDTLSNLVNKYSKQECALFQSAGLTEDRAMMMADYANYVLWMKYYGVVRQKGGLSSFHIPSKVITNNIWSYRYGDIPHQNQFHKRELREERIALEKHARHAGCRLIVNPKLTYETFGVKARIIRLCSLLEFLMTPENIVEIVFDENMVENESMTIVGDWFQAESHSAKQGHGYRQTIFTRHAPSMQYWIDLFDQEFDELLRKSKWNRENSKELAIKEIKKIIKVEITRLDPKESGIIIEMIKEVFPEFHTNGLFYKI